MACFQPLVAKLEGNSITFIEFHSVLTKFRENLKSRVVDKFFGFKVNNALPNLATYERSSFEINATSFISSCNNYLKKWYDFEGSPFQYFSNIYPSTSFSFKELITAAKLFYIHYDGDELYNDYQCLKSVSGQINDELPIDQQWSEYFKKSGNTTKNLLKIVQCILTITTSKAFPERVFSLMKQTWTKTSNRMEVDLVKAELLTIINFGMTCAEFFKYAKDNAVLLKKVQSTEKYK